MFDTQILKRDLARLRQQSPVVHNITNFVAMNPTANALLAIGASPVMAHSIDEVEAMVSIASSLVLNIGTLSASWVDAMLLAGQTAKKKELPVILDPVGAGATPYRGEVCEQLIQTCQPTIIRGNASEIMALVNSQIKTKGVDSTASSRSALEGAKKLASKNQTVVVVSGEVDYITNGQEIREVGLGHSLMPKVTGMGCTSTALLGAFAAINPDPLEAALNGMLTMGIAGAIAGEQAKGPGSLQVHFLDALFALTDQTIDQFFNKTSK